MSAGALALLALACPVILAAPAHARDAVHAVQSGDTAEEARVLVWKRKSYAFDELPRKVTDAAQKAVERWAPFAVAQGYDMGLTGDGRVLILHRLAGTQAARQLRTVDSVVRLFDEELPPPAPPKAGSAAAAPEPVQGLPEDPETPPVDIDDVGDATALPWTTSWGAGTRPNGTGTIVLVEVPDAAQYALFLEHLIVLAPHAVVWKERAATQSSCTLEDPLTGAWVLTPDAAEQWDPRAELIHRLAELLVTHRFGWQPYWVRQGWAWHAEWELTREVWSFPNRTQPVPPAEHGAWKKEVRRLVQARESSFGIEDLTALTRDNWDPDAARYCWATYRVLAAKHPRALSEVLAEFNSTWDTDNRVDYGGGNWRRDPTFGLTPKAQEDALRRHLDRDIFATLPKAFLKF